MRKVLRGYAKGKDGDLIQIGTLFRQPEPALSTRAQSTVRYSNLIGHSLIGRT